MSDVLDRLRKALADRYEVEEELGSGGMATVYLAHDVRHERWVAVKVLRPDLAATLGPERFHREIKIAAQLQHPHILPLLDSGEADDFLFYVMPFIEGQSLRDKLAKEGELPIGEAVRVLRDVVDALTAAHAHGVVHRDIKPENILLSGRHALVTDFGVAKAVSEATGREQLTTAGVALGTPAYMAPEQAAADPHLDHRVDIYAVGAVAYELLTGRPVFMGTTPQMVLSAHVTEAPQPVTKHRDTVPTALESVVMRCLEKKPADRYQSAEELLPQLEALATPSGGMTPTETRPVGAVPARRRRGIVFAAAAGAVALAAAAGLLLLRGEPDLNPSRVVVAPFENRTSDSALADLGDMAGEWITTGLLQAGIEGLEVVPRAMAVQALQSGETGGTADPVATLAEHTRSGLVVTGVYFQRADTVEFHASVVDAATGRVVHAVDPVSGPAPEAMALIETLRQRVAGIVASHLEFDWAAGLRSPPPSLEAFREASRGAAFFSRGEYREAVPHYFAAWELDTVWLSPLLVAATGDANLGEWARADSLLMELDARRERLTPVERSLLDNQIARVRGNTELAYRAARELARLDPVGGVYMAGLYAYRTNRPREAVDYLTQVDLGTRFSSQWLPSWTVLAAAYHVLGEHERELEVVRQAREAHPDRVSLRTNEAYALAALGRLDELKELVEESLALPFESWSPGGMMRNAARDLRAHGYREAAEDLLQRAVAYYEALPESEEPARSFRLAQTLSVGERWQEAVPIFERFLEEDPNDALVLLHVGVLAAWSGDQLRAREMSERLASLTEPYQFGVNTGRRAMIHAALGERERAVELLRESAGQGSYYGSGIHREPAFESLHDYPPFQALMRPKR